MGNFLTQLDSLVIFASLLLLFVFVLFLVFKDITKNYLEPVIRLFSIITGFIIFYGSKAVGLSMPQLILSSLKLADPIVYASGIGLSVSIISYFVTRYFINVTKKNAKTAVRLTTMVSVFVLLILADIFISLDSRDLKLDEMEQKLILIPNISFVLGVALYFVFDFDTTNFNWNLNLDDVKMRQ